MEGSDRQIHLAANFQDARSLLHPFNRSELLRERRDRRHVGGDILTDAAVAARGSLHEVTAFIAQAHRQAIDLQLADKPRLVGTESSGDAFAPRR